MPYPTDYSDYSDYSTVSTGVSCLAVYDLYGSTVSCIRRMWKQTERARVKKSGWAFGMVVLETQLRLGFIKSTIRLNLCH